MTTSIPHFPTIIGLIIVTYCVSISQQDDAPVIQIQSGRIKGEEKESRDDKDFYAYRGIPYAKAKRFEAPQKPDNWTDIRDAEEYGKNCIHYSTFEKKVVGSEDCLFINVFTPEVGEGLSKKLLPVMVFIHGGFMDGTSDIYRAHYFMDEEVVIVTFNYRLNVFGFLSTGDDVIRGNNGLKDQIMALQWVQDNIRKFSGDSNRVTIFGSGDGASSVHLLMLSPLGKGLFRKAITQSGSALKLSVIQKRPKDAAAKLAREFKCEKVLNTSQNATKINDGDCLFQNSTLIVECLKLVDAKKLADHQKNYFTLMRDPLTFFGPVVESRSVHNNLQQQPPLPFLTEHPFSIISSGRQIRVPWMTGFNAHEGLQSSGVILAEKTFVDKIDSNWMELSAKLLHYDTSRTDTTNDIRRFYLSDKNYEFVDEKTKHTETSNSTSTLTATPVLNNMGSTTSATIPDHVPLRSINFEEQFKHFTDLFTDRFYATSVVEAVQMQAKLSPVYVYYNSYEGQYSMLDVYTGKAKEPAPAVKKVTNWFKKNILGRPVQAPKHMGVCNGDELLLLFKYPDLKIKETSPDFQMSKSLVKLWVQFANDETTMHFHNSTWFPARPELDKFNVMKIGKTKEESGFGSLEEIFWDRIKFWKAIKYLAPFDQF